MTAYAIMYGATPADRFSAVRCADRTAARAYVKRQTPHVPPEGNAGGCGYVIETAEDVTWGGALLVAVYGALTGSAPSKFETRAAGIERLMRALETHTQAPSLPPEAEQPPAQENPQLEVTESSEMPKSNAAVKTEPKRGRKTPAGRAMTLTQQMNYYNELCDKAAAKGLNFKKHTSVFFTYDQGERVITKVQKAILEA